MYARNAYRKQRDENLMSGRSPSTSDEDAAKERATFVARGDADGAAGPRIIAIPSKNKASNGALIDAKNSCDDITINSGAVGNSPSGKSLSCHSLTPRGLLGNVKHKAENMPVKSTPDNSNDQRFHPHAPQSPGSWSTMAAAATNRTTYFPSDGDGGTNVGSNGLIGSVSSHNSSRSNSRSSRSSKSSPSSFSSSNIARDTRHAHYPCVTSMSSLFNAHAPEISRTDSSTQEHPYAHHRSYMQQQQYQQQKRYAPASIYPQRMVHTPVPSRSIHLPNSDQDSAETSPPFDSQAPNMTQSAQEVICHSCLSSRINGHGQLPNSNAPQHGYVGHARYANGYDNNPTLEHSAHMIAKNSRQKRRTRALLVLAAVAFMGTLVLDGLAQWGYLTGVEMTSGRVVGKLNHGFDATENELIAENGNYEREMNTILAETPRLHEDPQSAGVMRRLVGALMHDTTPNRSHNTRSLAISNSGNDPSVINSNDGEPLGLHLDGKARTLHTFPLLPKYSLQNRRRRELMENQKPIPPHLMEGEEDEMYHAPVYQRRRMYPMAMLESPVDDNHEHKGRREMKVVDARMVQRRVSGSSDASDNEEVDEVTLYETGSLYQGYGTHYIDLWVGTPPQRQTVIVDTGSSVTAFPCTGCDHCGTNPSTGVQYHLDPDFETESSSTYKQETCRKMASGVSEIRCPLGVCVREDLEIPISPQICRLAVSYAEGSTWTAVEGSDIVYPAGPHNMALHSTESMAENGVGIGMADFSDDNPFDWMDFRLTFGCQTKVTGLFRTQLEDGIMGMDNRPGSFWLQLRDHYKKNHHVQEEGDTFDPSRFSLCYDRQPLSMDLTPGVESGALTLGGSDPLLQLTPMVYADNITPNMGWYTVRIKGMFLRTKGGTLLKPHPNAAAVRYIRVDADEKFLNGDSRDGSGVIVDSGTTDTYLSELLKPAFEQAWKEALKNPGGRFHNNPIHMTPEQIKTLPTILIVLQGHKLSIDKELQPNPATSVGMAGNPAHSRLFEKNPHNKTSNSFSKTDIVVAVPPEHYMEESHREPGKYTARVYFTERYGAQAILGSNFIMGHEILFDNGMGRLGFSESHCDYSKYISERDRLIELQEEELQRVATLAAEEHKADASNLSTMRKDNEEQAESFQQKEERPQEMGKEKDAQQEDTTKPQIVEARLSDISEADATNQIAPAGSATSNIKIDGEANEDIVKTTGQTYETANISQNDALHSSGWFRKLPWNKERDQEVKDKYSLRTPG